MNLDDNKAVLLPHWLVWVSSKPANTPLLGAWVLVQKINTEDDSLHFNMIQLLAEFSFGAFHFSVGLIPRGNVAATEDNISNLCEACSCSNHGDDFLFTRFSLFSFTPLGGN